MLLHHRHPPYRLQLLGDLRQASQTRRNRLNEIWTSLANVIITDPDINPGTRHNHSWPWIRNPVSNWTSCYFLYQLTGHVAQSLSQGKQGIMKFFIILMIVTPKPDGTNDFSIWSFDSYDRCAIVAATQKKNGVQTFCLKAPPWEPRNPYKEQEK